MASVFSHLLPSEARHRVEVRAALALLSGALLDLRVLRSILEAITRSPTP